MRRRRKPAVMWLPNASHNVTNDQGWIESSNNVGPTAGPGGINTVIQSLTLDYPADAVRAGAGQPLTLADWQGSGYRLRRIVGKFFCGIDQDVGNGQATTYPEAALVGAGLIILRVDSTSGAPLNATANDYSPLDLEAAQDPWIWRRTWLLSNFQGYAGGGGAHTAYGYYPYTNAEYGSVKDGPHVDQKTARRVSDEERLFLVVSTAAVNSLAANTAGTVRWLFEYRLLASPLKLMGNRRNASR